MLPSQIPLLRSGKESGFAGNHMRDNAVNYNVKLNVSLTKDPRKLVTNL
jgi:hypothetical protein